MFPAPRHGELYREISKKDFLPVSFEVMSHAFVEHPYACVTMPFSASGATMGREISGVTVSLSTTPKKTRKARRTQREFESPLKGGHMIGCSK